MTVQIIVGDALTKLGDMPDESAHCCVTSPPYFGLRDYGAEGQIGLETTPQEYVDALVGVFREARRVLRGDGTLWLNLGDSYASGGRRTRDPGKSKIHPAFEGDAFADGLRPVDPPGIKPKDLLGTPWRVAFALQADGWYLRKDNIWHKPNAMPESVEDRPTSAHEYLFLLSKSERYFYDAAAIREDEVGRGGGRNKRSVWTVATHPYTEAHFATFPPALIEPCIKAGCPTGGTVLDCFGGAGTTGLVADRLGRNAILIELNPSYAEMARRRITADAGMFAAVAT